MLRSLTIQNFALIEQVQLHFEPGFTVITGETGSGKSILLGALNLILGERADFGVIRNPNEKTSVEAVFKIDSFQLESYFEENDLDFATETVIRREITAQGRSRAFVNDTPVQLPILKELTEKLVHIHSQHHTLELKNPMFQLDLLDVLSDSLELRKTVKTDFFAWKKAMYELEEKQKAYQKSVLDADYNQFQLEELSGLQLDETDFSALESELNSLEHIEAIKSGFASIVAVVEGDHGTSIQLAQLKMNLEKVSQHHEGLRELAERLQTIRIEIQDISQEAESQLSELEMNPERQFLITNQLDELNRIMRKHNVSSPEELIAIRDEISAKQSNSFDLENDIQRLTIEVEKLKNKLIQASEKLNKNRNQKSPLVAKQLMDVLNELKLVGAKVDFELVPQEKLDEIGGVKLVLHFSPNEGLPSKPIEKAASGGELSRFMLALQLLLSSKKALPTLLFDEIDTGVSGDVAQKIGVVLQRMGKSMQVFAITHLPQVAGKGENHWKVTKNALSGITVTEVMSLNLNQRIEEIARLMSGENINEAALLNAKALMEN
jgi:DNA repair protein RecN (Recombination protein N)